MHHDDDDEYDDDESQDDSSSTVACNFNLNQIVVFFLKEYLFALKQFSK
jgi:hypothetical protein